MSRVRVMTLNLNGGVYPETGPRSWAERATHVVGLIQRHAPDLIGFQEVNQANLITLAAQLPMYHQIVGNAYGDNPPAEHTSILLNAERFALIESGEFWLSRTPDLPSCDWNVPYPMGATWARLQERTDGTSMLLVNTHYEDGPDGEESRVEGSRLIVARIAQLAPDIPSIVTGDFNGNPDSAAYKTFLDAGFVDTYRAAGHADGADSTFHGFVGDQYNALEWGDAPFWRIDWILVRGGGSPSPVQSCTIIRDSAPPIYPSDHYPVMADLALAG
jgi:endonuclease/exonuclease/phosphatase family metal-dependent hydrolase